MSGRQFSFYLGPTDQLPFERALKMSGEVAFLSWKPSSRHPEELHTSVLAEFGKEDLAILIALRKDINAIHFRPIKGRNEFSCDVTRESVVEFSRCYVTDRFIRAGRLYRVDKCWNEDDVLVAKSREFVEWGNQLYKLAKKSLTRIEPRYFAGAEALEMRKAGVAFEGLDIPIGSINA